MKLKKIYLLIIILLSISIMTFYFSYAFFTNKVEGNGKLNIIAGTLDYKIESNNLKNNKITVESGNIEILDISLTSLNTISSKYEVYYILDKGNIDDVIVGYGNNYEKSSGTIDANETKKIRVFINNQSEDSITVEFGAEGGFIHNELTLSNYNSLVSDDSIPTITFNPNLPSSVTKGDSFEIIGTVTANGPSGVWYFCESNPDGIISNTSELKTLGTHKIYCTASTGAGINKVIETTLTLTYQGYTAQNIIANGSFENGTTGWNIATYYGTFESSTDFATNGSHSLKIIPITSANESLVFYSTKITYTKGHKYYAIADSYVPENGVSSAAQIYLVDSNYTTTGYVKYGMAYKGKNKLSFYLDEPTWETTTTMNFRLDNDNNYSDGPIYFDSILLIDLTETFGAGNEPDKEWCDKHISYFDGTTTIYK